MVEITMAAALRPLRISARALMVIGVAMAAAACARTTQDGSVSEHVEAAAREEQLAREQAAELKTQEDGFQPNTCTDDLRSPACWSPARREEEHQRAIERHRRAAAEHRREARALVEAEQESCTGLSDDERDISPFFHVADIQSVTLRDDGAVVRFGPVRNLTEDRLRRHVQCHLARNASLGHRVPEMDYCLLVPRDVEATVTSTPNGLEVAVTATTDRARRELYERAQALQALVSSS